MSEEQNVLEQLRNRQRTSVPNRIDSLNPKTENQSQELTQQNLTTSRDTDSVSTLEDLQRKLREFPKTKRRSAIVVEENIDVSLSQYCRSHQITVETFLEAAWTICQSNKTTQAKITKEAQSRYKNRKEAGRLRRLITMLSKE